MPNRNEVSKLRIVLADDHETVRTGLRVILDAQPDMKVIAEASDGQTAVDHASRLRPDLVIMDISMPRLNGLAATERLHRCCPDVKVLTLTRHSDRGYVQQMLRAGARGYVLKQSKASEVLLAIRAIARGGVYLDSAVTEQLLSSAASPTHYGAAAQPAGGLSPREEQIFKLTAWGFSNKEMAVKLELSVKTIETHKTNAMHKLGMHNRTDVVRFALLQGWLEES